jgi:thiosulfate/3-mercaptopyruvate sulfurtransferase
VRIVEVDADTSAYQQGHVRGAAAWNWSTELYDTVRRDIKNYDGSWTEWGNLSACRSRSRNGGRR